jgi:hypothetical protein
MDHPAPGRGARVGRRGGAGQDVHETDELAACQRRIMPGQRFEVRLSAHHRVIAAGIADYLS